MRTSLKILSAFALLPLLLGSNHAALARSTAPSAMQLYTSDLHTSVDWRSREIAFRHMQTLKSDKITNEKLINLLALESRYVSSVDDLPEEYTNYYADLIETVANLHDFRAVDVLLTKNVLTTGDTVINGLAGFGDKISDRVIAQYAHVRSEMEQISLLRVIVAMLQTHTLKEQANKKSFETLLLKAAKDKRSLVRRNAMLGLACFNDRAAKKALRKASRMRD